MCDLVLMDNKILIYILVLIGICYCVYIYFKLYGVKKEKFEPVVKKSDWLNEIFDEIQIITIPSRIKNVNKFCKELEIKENIFPAILKDDLSYNNIYSLKTGEIACALSQEQVLKNFVESGKETLLLFEDDIIPMDHLLYKRSKTSLTHVKNYMKTASDYLPVGWDVMYFGRCWDMCSKHVPVNKFIVKVFRALCHHAIAFSRDGAIKILANIKHPIQQPIDHIVSGLCMKGLLHCYASVVPVFYQNREELYTTIGNFDKLPVCL